jgi:hypothetical protein
MGYYKTCFIDDIYWHHIGRAYLLDTTVQQGRNVKGRTVMERKGQPTVVCCADLAATLCCCCTAQTRCQVGTSWHRDGVEVIQSGQETVSNPRCGGQFEAGFLQSWAAAHRRGTRTRVGRGAVLRHRPFALLQRGRRGRWRPRAGPPLQGCYRRLKCCA